jgi:hypothetical protein
VLTNQSKTQRILTGDNTEKTQQQDCVGNHEYRNNFPKRTPETNLREQRRFVVNNKGVDFTLARCPTILDDLPNEIPVVKDKANKHSYEASNIITCQRCGVHAHECVDREKNAAGRHGHRAHKPHELQHNTPTTIEVKVKGIEQGRSRGRTVAPP